MPRSLQKRTNSHHPSTSQIEVQTSLGQSIKQGFGFGMGSHLANVIVGTAGRQNPSESKPIESKPTEYSQCMIDYNDKAACAYLQNA